jgi:hypothetical protein
MKKMKLPSSARGPAAVIAAVAIAAGAGIAWWWLRGNRTRRGVDEALRSEAETSEKPIKRARKAA